MNNIKKKGILLVVSILLLIAAGVYLTLGWYTKMTSAGNIQFDVAKWDFAANYSVDDYALNVYTYNQARNAKAAPGTAGYIPIKLSATSSDTDVYYSIIIDKSSMQEVIPGQSFANRIFFYADKEMTMPLGEMDEEGNTYDINGTIPYGKDVEVVVYWKWIYEYENDPELSNDDNIAAAKAFDDFDTEVGKRPDLYEKYMNATLKISGYQVLPTQSESEPEPELTT